jgi:AraC-like DNA-binding protein
MQFLTRCTGDLDEAHQMLDEHYAAGHVELLTPRPGWRARFDLTPRGPVTIGDLGFGVDVRARFGQLGAYHVGVPRSGHLIWHQGRDEPRRATPGSAAVFQPVGDTVLDRWPGNCRLLSVRIDSAALEKTLAALLDAPVRGPVRLGPVLDIGTGPGAAWRRLLAVVAGDARRPDGLFRHPMIGGCLQESLIAGLLLATDHPYREQLSGQTPLLTAPATVRRAVDEMHADPGRPLTVLELAHIAGVGARSLQLSFQRYVGTSPMGYLRQLRLARAHDDLRRSDPATDTVSAIAMRNGFPHFGRFAAAYRLRYGVSPRDTLRT